MRSPSGAGSARVLQDRKVAVTPVQTLAVNVSGVDRSPSCSIRPSSLLQWQGPILPALSKYRQYGWVSWTEARSLLRYRT
jgi:hypothetical protein